ncbi:MAG: murein L,D-transpeptidase [Devosiaceae bacterium]|nr:murein L,D-transpeptidase [Devosiaceae bacterium MH13]
MKATKPSTTSLSDMTGARPGLERRTLLKVGLLASAAPLLAACQSEYMPKHLEPLPWRLVSKMEALGVSEASPVFMRIFKEESILEVWKETASGRYILLEEYEICTWSGALGPKFQEGDRQAPEGFYTVRPAQMNPNSSFYLSFNLGFPNAYDRSHGRTGSHLMVHGACSSAGCYAMTDEQIAEIYALARDAFEGGQRAFQVHAFPFRMTPENMARHADHEHFAFWQMLQEGYQHFEVTGFPPRVDVCDRRYIFNAEAAGQFAAAEQCPSYTTPPQISDAVAMAQAEHQQAFEVALAEIRAEQTVPALLPNDAPAIGGEPTVMIAEPAAPPIAPLESDAALTTASIPTAEGTGVEAASAFAEPQAQRSFLDRAGSMFDGLFSGNSN